MAKHVPERRVGSQSRPTGLIEVVPTTYEHCLYVAKHMRPGDKAECTASSGDTPLDALWEGANKSAKVFTGIHDGDPFAIFGVVSGTCGTGYVWLLGTPRISKVARSFHRASKRWLRELEKGYALVGNAVDERNTVHVRWLKALGFEVKRELDGWGTNGEKFLEMWKVTDV